MQSGHLHQTGAKLAPNVGAQALRQLRMPQISDRIRALGEVSYIGHERVLDFVALAKRGLPQMRCGGGFAHTVRRVSEGSNHRTAPEGDSLRYTLIAAMGLSRLVEDEQRHILAGDTAADLVRGSIERAERSADAGAVALAAWAAAEVLGIYVQPLFDRLKSLLSSNVPAMTVDCAWALAAAVAARHLGPSLGLARLMRNRILSGRSGAGLFPHWLPASAAKRMRAHVGCFADQVYPIQALSRLAAAEGDAEALAAADACAARLCALQGQAGQWWWHYDTRDGSVVEGYPVYSVHQHAMAPMALMDLAEAGGRNHLDALAKGLDWLDRHPEAKASLVSEEHAVIWRKVARREPGKAVRAIAASATALRPGLRLPGLDAIFPPVRIDHECRPYELGWLLYAWLGSPEGGAAQTQAQALAPAR